MHAYEETKTEAGGPSGTGRPAAPRSKAAVGLGALGAACSLPPALVLWLVPGFWSSELDWLRLLAPPVGVAAVILGAFHLRSRRAGAWLGVILGLLSLLLSAATMLRYLALTSR